MDAVIEEKSSMDADLGSTKGSRNKKLAEESSYAKGRTRIKTTTNGRGVEAERGVSGKRARKHVGSCGKGKEGTSLKLVGLTNSIMVVEPWLLRMGIQMSSNLKHVLLLESSSKPPTMNKQKIRNRTTETIRVLSFKIPKSDNVKTLVSSNEIYLLDLALWEKLDDLSFIADMVSRLRKNNSKGFSMFGTTIS
ncbi:hypothetical protein L6452_22410 [Arctium lappa]|uniref:Uncharacterized protein n=1 Tax=Arctium lappa TaxID=4217 RepID=A0ACB9B1G5_ARCLA|nr:hypothetical protein L6452_22410 [Arctium lappa]